MSIEELLDNAEPIVIKRSDLGKIAEILNGLTRENEKMIWQHQPLDLDLVAIRYAYVGETTKL